MRTTTSSLLVVTAFGVMGCMGNEPEPVEPAPRSTAGMEMDEQAQMDERATEMRDEYREPEPQFGELEPEPSTEPPTYGEMQQDPGQMQPQYGQADPMGEPGWEQPTAGDRDMSTRIEEALRTAPNLDDDAIAVRVEGSRVHLAGLVDSPTEVMTARDVVSSIPGVSEVDVNQLEVITQR